MVPKGCTNSINRNQHELNPLSRARARGQGEGDLPGKPPPFTRILSQSSVPGILVGDAIRNKSLELSDANVVRSITVETAKSISPSS